jgi:outer-membrane receptor for ferric coprogen and ferric-rhodotorulic acid
MLRFLVAGVACALACSAAAPSDITDKASAQYSLKIQRQSLAAALQQFAGQSGLQIIFFSKVVEGLQAPALEGTFTVDTAMRRLLAGSGLVFQAINPKTFEVHAAPAKTGRSRPEVVADIRPKHGDARRPRPQTENSEQVDEVVVMGTAEQLVATRMATPLREIPQTVSIVSREQIRQQNDTDLSDVLRNAAGITMVRTSSLDEQFYSRAYQITSFHVDGGAALNPRINSAVLFMGTPDLSEFDHVEVLRGSDALFGGNGNPGGTVSLVRKRPLGQFQLDVNASTGSWNNNRVEVDVTGPIGFDGSLRGRMDAVYVHRDYFYDISNLERERIFASIEYDMTATATLTAGASYQRDDALPFVNGLPLYKDGNDPRLPRNTSLTFNWAFSRTGVSEAYLQYRQKFDGDWALKFNASGWRARVEYGIGTFGSLIDPITQGLDTPTSIFTGKPNIDTQATTDITLTGVLNWLGWREELAIGADFTRLAAQLDVYDGGSPGGPLNNVHNFDPRNYADPRLMPADGLAFDGTSTLDQYGVFSSLRVSFDDAWSVSAGARVGSDNIDTKLNVGSRLLRASLAAKFGNVNVVTPYGGVMYAINGHYSLYASYADIYLSEGDLRTYEGHPLGAASGVNIETGIKGAWRDGAVNASLVLYKIAQSNLPLSDPRPRPPGAVFGNCCFVGATSRSKGVDLELSGALSPSWLVAAGYTYNNNRAATGGGSLSTSTPLHLLKVWTSKQLPGAFNRWTVGGSVRAQTRTTAGGSYCPPNTGFCLGFESIESPYAVLDLRSGFQINPHWQAAVSINNVADKNYYETLGTPALHTWYGEPRSFILRLDGRY